MKYILALLLLTTPAMADTVKIKSCVGNECRTKIVRSYTQQQINKIPHEYSCVIGKVNHRMIGNRAEWVPEYTIFGINESCQW